MEKTENSNQISIVLPCLNEAETLDICIKKGMDSIHKSGYPGEIIIADNGSTDGSLEIAKSRKVKIVNIKEKGYGAALIGGIEEACGKWIIMADSDDSYALDELELFINKLNEGFQLVMGNRFKGGIERKAMPWMHKYVGNPILSWLGRKIYKAPIGDFHCGLRAFDRASIQSLQLKSPGMEFASEMIAKASLNGLRIAEVPTTLKKDGRTRRPHLRTWSDGWRHLVFLLAGSPRFLFLYPGFFIFILGFLGTVATVRGPIQLFYFELDLNAYLISIGTLLVGFQTILLAILARIYSLRQGFLPESIRTSLFSKVFTLERGLVLGGGLIASSILGLIFLVGDWTGKGFNTYSLGSSLRISGLFILFLASGIQLLFASFFASILQTK